jgi:penicillin-binding protein 1A
MGYDTPRSLGDRETGGRLSLPVWISFMETALRGVPVKEVSAPEGVVNSGGEWFLTSSCMGAGVSNLGLDERGAKGSAPGASTTQELPPADERKRILDLFKN